MASGSINYLVGSARFWTIHAILFWFIPHISQGSENVCVSGDLSGPASTYRFAKHC